MIPTHKISLLKYYFDTNQEHLAFREINKLNASSQKICIFCGVSNDIIQQIKSLWTEV